MLTLSKSYQDLAPWLCASVDRKSRAYLENHLELLDEDYDHFLAVFIDEHKDEQHERRRLRMLRHLRHDAEKRGKTPQAVREAYINMLGGLILDPPAWLRDVEQEWAAFSDDSWTERRLTVCKLHLKKAIERAQTCPETPREITAELQYELANFLANDRARCSTATLGIAVELYTAALEVYTAERYPLRCGLVMLTLGDVYRCLADNQHEESKQRAELMLKSLHYYSLALKLYETYDFL